METDRSTTSLRCCVIRSPPSPEGELMETFDISINDTSPGSPPSPEGELMETLALPLRRGVSPSHRLRLKEN
jgi:hypothetical protein